MAEEKEKKEVVEEKSFEELAFEKFCQNNDIECDIEKIKNEKDLDALEDCKKRFCKAVAQKRVEVSGGDLIYTVSRFSPEGFAGERLTIKAPKGNAFIGGDGDAAKKSMAIMSAMTGKDVGYFAKLDVRDYMFFVGIVGVFLL